jgi:hypothetical protein
MSRNYRHTEGPPALMLEPRFVGSVGTTAKTISADSQEPAETDQSEPDHTPDHGSSDGDDFQVVAVARVIDEGAFKSLDEEKSGYAKNWQRKSANLPYGPAYDGYGY